MQRTESESRDLSLVKPLLLGSIVFLTLGITIASETLSRFGLQHNYVILFTVAFVLAVLIVSRNLMMIVPVFIGVIAMNLPEATLSRLNLDQDVLLALVCAVVLVPTVYKLFVK